MNTWFLNGGQTPLARMPPPLALDHAHVPVPKDEAAGRDVVVRLGDVGELRVHVGDDLRDLARRHPHLLQRLLEAGGDRGARAAGGGRCS